MAAQSVQGESTDSAPERSIAISQFHVVVRDNAPKETEQ